MVPVFNDVETPVVHYQRNIHVYHFVYLRPTQGAQKFSVCLAFGSRTECFVTCDCYSIRENKLENEILTFSLSVYGYSVYIFNQIC